MKLQYKILILLTIIFGILSLSFLSYQYIRVKEKKLYYTDNQKNQELIINKVIELNRVKYEQLLNDNSGWDDMLKFVAKPDSVWAKDNVNFFVNSFKLSFVLTYNKEKELVYQFGDSSCLKKLEYPDQTLINLHLGHSPYSHYFQFCGNKLIEIFGAIIVPGSDADARKTPAQGYLFTGREWNNDYIADHEEATGYQIRLLTNQDLSALKKEPSKIYFFKDITNSAGEKIASLVFSKEDPLISDLEPLMNLSFIVAICSVLSMIVIFFFFRKIILLPISKISEALDTHDSKCIDLLSKNNDEFKTLSSLILRYFDQQELFEKNNAELMEINATKDRLFSILAHDLKNPVGNIVMMSEILVDHLKNRDLVTSEELAGLLNQQSKETLSLLTTLFDWARSQTGQINFKPAVMNLNTVVENVLENLYSAAKLKEIIILPNEVKNALVYADAHMLSTILRNLVTNSIKFTNAGGTILVSAQMKPEKTEITIMDTGIGMDEKIKERLFKIESNVSTYGTANEKGTGLGLIVCKDFIERHGGTIALESQPGVGSKFILTLPFNELLFPIK